MTDQPQVVPYWKPERKARKPWRDRRKPIRQQSEKAREQAAIRRANLHREYGRFPACAACGPLAAIGVTSATTGCYGHAEDGHEPLTRRRGGDPTDPAQVLPVSRACHDYIHDHPDVATAAGLLIPSGPRCLP